MPKIHILPLGLFATLTFFCCQSVANSSNSIKVNAKPTIEYHYLTTNDADDEHVRQIIQDSEAIQIIRRLSQSTVIFTPSISIVFGTAEGPLYDPEQHQILIPYSFIHHAIERFQTNNYKEFGISAQQAALDTLFHTLLHELGHAYIAANNIPVLGKEEDAVDNFATVLLLNYVDSGAEIAISAADLFAFEDQQIEGFDSLDFIDEHSLDIQRYYYTLCLIYGSDPERHSQLLADIDKAFKTEREEVCLDEFARITNSWMTYLNGKNSRSSANR